MTDAVDESPQHCYRHPGSETLVRCSGCERPICTACMHATPVGVRCGDCAGAPSGVRRAVERSYRRGRVPVTSALISSAVAVFVAQVATATGGGLVGGVTQRLQLWGPAVADGEWWRIVSVALTHGGIGHLLMNMLSLWIVGSIIETALGPARYLGIYVAAVVWGSAGALLLEGDSAAVGASGGIFGLLAAIAVIQLIRRGGVSGDILGVLVLNLFITFTIPGISIGGHIGGIVGGALVAVVAAALPRVRGGRAAWVEIGVVVAVVSAGFALSVWAAERTVQIAMVGA